MDTLPILFTFRRTLFGAGSAVEVKATNGRALCVPEDDGVWMYGVNPGGMAALGGDQEQARAEFSRVFTRILKDLATEATSLEGFRALVNTFFHETNEGFEPEWLLAVQAVRAHRVSDVGLPSISADAPRSLSVEIKEIANVNATDNDTELTSALAA